MWKLCHKKIHSLRGNAITGCSMNGVARVRSTYHAHKGEGGAMYSESLLLALSHSFKPIKRGSDVVASGMVISFRNCFGQSLHICTAKDIACIMWNENLKFIDYLFSLSYLRHGWAVITFVLQKALHVYAIWNENLKFARQGSTLNIFYKRHCKISTSFAS